MLPGDWSRFLRSRLPVPREAYAAAKSLVYDSDWFERFEAHLDQIVAVQAKLFEDPAFTNGLARVRAVQRLSLRNFPDLSKTTHEVAR